MDEGALELVGERWSLLIIRHAMFAGCTRFSEFERRLGIAPNILATRLERFVELALMERRAVAGDSVTQEYVLTEQGLGLQPVLVALTEWGDRWLAPRGAPIVYEHDGCGGSVRQHLDCDRCSAEPDPQAVAASLVQAHRRCDQWQVASDAPRRHDLHHASIHRRPCRASGSESRRRRGDAGSQRTSRPDSFREPVRGRQLTEYASVNAEGGRDRCVTEPGPLPSEGLTGR